MAGFQPASDLMKTMWPSGSRDLNHLDFSRTPDIQAKAKCESTPKKLEPLESTILGMTFQLFR